MRSVRLHLDESSASSTATTGSVVSSWSDGEPPPPPLPLSIALRGLVADAETLHDRLKFATFVNIAESPRLPYYRDGQAQWKRVERSLTFTLLKRENEVLALVRLDASVQEVISILGATTNQLHTTTMKGLYGDAFIAGSVAYVQRPRAYEDGQKYQHLAVKTSSFVHSDMLGKNEQWCFAETLRCKPEAESITLTQASLPAHQAYSLPARSALKDSSRRVAQLRDVTTAYLVERMPGSHSLRVVFHASHKVTSTAEIDDEEESPSVAGKALRTRLLRLARGVSQLSQFVRRRRFGTQVYVDRSAFDERNPRCTCCTRKLTMFVPRTQCYLCGYYVCVACSSSEKMVTRSGRLVSITVCSRCRKSATACNCAHMMAVILGPERILHVADQLSIPHQQISLLSPTSSRSTSNCRVFHPLTWIYHSAKC